MEENKTKKQKHKIRNLVIFAFFVVIIACSFSIQQVRAFVFGSEGIIDFWSRTGTTLSPRNTGDDLDLGSGYASATQIKVKEGGASPTYFTILQGGDQSADITYTLPTASSTGLLKNTAGTLSWDASDYLTSSTGLTATGATTGATSQAQAFTNGVITGKIYPSSNSTTAVQINKADGTTNVLNVDTTNAYVGIGTTSPVSPLTVFGGTANSENETLVVSGGGVSGNGVTGASIAFGNRYGTDPFPTWRTASIGGVYLQSTSYGGGLVFNTNGAGTLTTLTERMRIDNYGKVGIATTAPDKVLEINSADGNNLRLTYNDSNGSAANYTDLLVGSTGDLTITPSGGDATLNANLTATSFVKSGGTSSQFLKADGSVDSSTYLTSLTGALLATGATTGATSQSQTFTNGITVSAANIVTDTTTGTIIGTATDQKLGFFNATPVVQQLATADLGTALSNLGLRAAGTAYPITTSGLVKLQNATSVELGAEATTMTAGQIKLWSAGTQASNDFYTTITAGMQTANATYTLPTASSNGYLQNTDGTLSWGTVDLTGYAKLDGSNQPFTGNLNISKATPSLTLTSTDDSSNTAILSRSLANREFTLKNYVGTPESTPYSVKNSGTSAWDVAVSGNALPGQTGTVSFWLRSSASPTTTGYFMVRGKSTLYVQTAYSTSRVLTFSGKADGSTQWSISSSPLDLDTWYHVVCRYTTNSAEMWINGALIGSKDTVNDVNVVDSVYHQIVYLLAQTSGTTYIDGASSWSRYLTDEEVGDLYNSGNGLYLVPANTFASTGTPISTNLLGIWHFDNANTDSSGNGYTATLTNTAYDSSTAKVQIPGSASQSTVISSKDGVNSGEKGIHTFGDSSGRTVLDGLTTRFNVSGTEKGQVNSTGLTLIDSFPVILGTGSDASLTFDGDSFNIKSNLVTATDKLELTGGTSGIDFIIGSTSQGVITANTLTLADAFNIAVNTTTGTKIGTATSQKLGFFNATPVVQQLATADLGTALSNLGLRAAGTAYPITTSGAVTLGSLTATRVPYAGTAGLLQDSASLTFDGTSLTAGGFIKSGGTSSQFLKADGSVDSSTYIASDNANWTTLTNDSMADALHRHSELSASDGTPNPALSVDASGNVGIGTTEPTAYLDIPSHSTTTNNAQFGTFGIQSYAVNNGWLSDNAYYNGANFIRRSAGYVALMRFTGDTGAYRLQVANTGTAGSTASMLNAINVRYNGGYPAVQIGDINAVGTYAALTVKQSITPDNLAQTQLNAISANGKPLVIQGFTSQTNSLMEWQKSDGTVYGVIDSVGKVGIGTTAPDKALEINSADGNNLRLTYNDSNGSAANYTDLLVGSTGDLTITPSGGDATLNANLTATSFIKSGGTSSQFLKADGSVDSSTYLTAEADTLQTVMTRGATTATQLTSTLATGTSPFAVTSTTVNTNLNADSVDAYHFTGASGNVTADAAELNKIDGYTGTAANLNTLTDDSMADALHRHSELSASDGTPNPALSVDASGNVGIGTTTPTGLLNLSSASSQLVIDSYDSGPGYTSTILFRTARGTPASPTATQSGDVLGFFGFRGYYTGSWSSNSSAAFIAWAAENFTSTAQGTYLTLSTSPTGSAGAVERLRVTAAGKLGIGTSGPDKILEINSADGNNLRLTYNDSNGSAANYTDLLVGSTGDLTITPSGGDATLNANLTATSFIKSGGTSSQFLKADGSVDSSTYIASDNANWTTLTNDSMADALHRHSELSASDGTPNPVVSVGADGLVQFGQVANNIYISGTNPNTLNSYYSADSDGVGFYINYRGYNDGFTRNRDFYIADGKSNVFLSAIGATQQVGIGNTPQSKLDVSGRIIQRGTATNSINTYFQANGDAQAEQTNLNPGVLLWQSANDAYGIDLGYSSTSTGGYGVRAFFPSNREFAVASYVANTLPTAQSGFTYHMVVEGDGKVGIGTVTPNRNLEISGTGNVVNRITGDDAFLELRDKSTNNQMSFQFTDGNNLQLRYGASLAAGAYSTTDLVSFKPDGKVGIGTTTPRELLDVAGNITASNYYIRSADNAYSGRLVDGTTYLTLDAYNGSDWTSRNMRIQGNEIYFLDGATTEVMRIKSGKVGIGTTAPDKALEINSADGNNLRLTYNDSNGSAANYADLLLSSSGDLTINASGGDIDLGNENLTTTGTGTFSGGITTKYATEDPSLTVNGQIAVSYEGTAPRIRFVANGTEYYIDKTGGFGIPGHETVDPISGDKMKIGDIILGMINQNLGDADSEENSSLHGIWVKWDSVKAQLLAEARGELSKTGTWGTGSISGVSTETLLDKVTNVLTGLGISIKDEVTSIANLATTKFSAKVARMDKIEMVATNGDIYCTWINDNGDWQKVKGDCASVVVTTAQVSAPAEQTPVPEQAPAPEQAPVPEQTPAVEQTPVLQETPVEIVAPTETPVPKEAPVAEETSETPATSATSASDNQPSQQHQSDTKIKDKDEKSEVEQTPADLVIQPDALSADVVNPSQETPVETPEQAPTLDSILENAAANLVQAVWNFLKSVTVSFFNNLSQIFHFFSTLPNILKGV